MRLTRVLRCEPVWTSKRDGCLAAVLACSVGLVGCGPGTVASTANADKPSTITLSVAGPAQTRIGVPTQYVVSESSNAPVTWTPVIWSINGVVGGSAALGTISSSGVYSAPVTLAGTNVAISAAAGSAASPALSVAVLNPLAGLSSGTVTLTTGSTFAVDLHGTGFVTGAALQVNGVTANATVISATELQSTVNLVQGTAVVHVGVLNPNASQSSPATLTVAVSGGALATTTQAARILDQTSFGPTLTSIAHVQQIGIEAYLDEQMAMPATTMAAIGAPPVAACPDATYRCVQSSFWSSALTANDQLRQRVAFALSEIFVVSTNEVNARTIPSFQNVLVNDAFGNYRQLMADVALSPAMGAYLNMLNSGAAPAGQIANENFAREFMQLFNTGLYLLNADGSLQLDGSGRSQAVFTEVQVEAYARAYTGWTYANSTGGLPTQFPNGLPNFDQPMQPFTSAHDSSAKALLSGVTLPSGQSAVRDLNGALDSVFAHPNVGPFVSRQLIQHLITSSPSPAYVGRVAAVFANNGAGVRGDLKAVVRAILLDPEARAADTDTTVDGGHLREPILFLTGILRGLEAVNVDPQGRYDAISALTSPLGQAPYTSPSVFNFFPPGYVIPGTSSNAPEFALENTAAAIARVNLADSAVRNHVTSFSVDMSATGRFGKIASQTGIAATDTASLVEALNLVFLHDQMPDAMRSSITGYASLFTDVGQRDRIATWLVLSSNFYKISH